VLVDVLPPPPPPEPGVLELPEEHPLDIIPNIIIAETAD